MTLPSTTFRMHLALSSIQEQLLDGIGAFDADPCDETLAEVRAHSARMVALIAALDETLTRTLDARPQPPSELTPAEIGDALQPTPLPVSIVDLPALELSP